MMDKGRLIVVSAPSGCGKGTILGRVFADSDVYYSVSCTTRAPREGEQNGREYIFLSVDEFEKMIADDGFLEYAKFAENYYGTPRKAAEDNLAEGRDVILEIETQGAFQIKEKKPEAVMIFILPPSIEELRRRLLKRGTETAEVIDKRVSQAAGEIEKAYNYDFVIMNDDLDTAVADFETVINSISDPAVDAGAHRADNEQVKKMIREVLENDA